LSILRAARREVAGAWRSLRYDIHRRPGTADSPADGYPDVTSGGLSTFGGPLAEGMDFDPFDRPPRRLVAVTAFGALALAGAAGSYLAVINGLGALVGGPATPPPAPLPLVAEPVRSFSAPSGPTPRRVADTAAPTTGTPTPEAGDGRQSRPDRAQPARVRPRPPAPPVPTPCCPVPTPTSPRS
jgi:hypothetical protein